ncbi:MAG: N-formylglutamate amidohydrolase [Methylobacteriaceae bacterium]|nr:N-formylglutamate amidohydrolase [Methylobacteriaceae bacterium]
MNVASSPAVASVDFPPVATIPGALDAGVLFLCDHASNAVPPDYGDLGLPAGQFERHIAYDIGAAAMTRRLAALFGAPAVMTTFSRLLIDPNRGGDDPTLVMRISDGALIPGNARIGVEEIERRKQRFWRPYRDAVSATLDAMLATGVTPAIVSIHSFTPRMKGVDRPWQVGFLWDLDPRMTKPMIELMQADGDLTIGDNEPYDGALEGDTMDTHATARGLAGLLVEVRQELIADEAGAHAWADRLAVPLRRVLAREDVHRIEFHGSRCHIRHKPR